MEQILAHLWGDYLFQNNWMAQNKVKAWFPAFIHALTYSLLFLPLVPSVWAWLVIFGTHMVIDRFRLATYFISWYNRTPDRKVNAGFNPETPVWLATWLSIIIDNTLHLTINYLSIRFM